MAAKRGRPAGYKITLTLGANITTSKGKSVLDALHNLKRPEKITTKGTLLFEHNESKLERRFMPLSLRMFLRPIAEEIMAKQIASVLK